MAKKKDNKSFDELTKEEAELLSYKDITYILINEKGKMNTASLFRLIADKLELSSSAFEKQIGEYYTMLSTDKRFLLLQDGEWDLRDKHTSDKVIKTPISDDAEEEEEEEETGLEEDEEESEDDVDNYDVDDDDDDSQDEDLKDLVILDEDELELEE